MSEKSECQHGLVADATESLADDLLGLVEGVEAEIGQFAAFQIAPHTASEP